MRFESGPASWRIAAVGRGDLFVLGTHEQGTEVLARPAGVLGGLSECVPKRCEPPPLDCLGR